MDLKKKLKKFFTLRRRANAGFTLVELIVVIAVLSILGGVGTAGYSGYIKASNKGADKTLVGNVIRAIETGTNSMMFVSNDSFKMGHMSYPIGFITLSADESKPTQIMISKTDMSSPIEANCVFETIENVSYLEPATAKCSAGESWGTYYTLKTGSITYCTTHSPAGVAPSALTANKNYTSKISNRYGACNSVTGCINHSSYKTESASVPAGTVFVDGFDGLYGVSSNASMCTKAYNYQHGSFTGTPTVGAATSGNTLYDAIEAAFGDVEGLKLKYNSWVSEEGVDYSTFYTAAPNMMSQVENLSDMLVIGQGLAQLAGQSLVAGTYANGEEVLAGVSKMVVETFAEEDAWVAEWDMAAGDTWEGVRGFGLPGREAYSAARMGYNQAFGSYLDARQIESKYADLIKNYYTSEMFGVGLPGLVNTSAFTNDASGLKQDFIDAGDANAGQEGSAFNKCAALYEEYKDSAACEENGRVFYQTLATFHETADIAQAQVADGKYSSIYDYYNGYVNEIAKVYDEAQKAAGDGIVIIVTVEEGLVKCQVSPAAANPRND